MNETKRHKAAAQVNETGVFDSKWVLFAGMASLLCSIPLGIALLVPLPAWILLVAIVVILTSASFVFVRNFRIARKRGMSRLRAAGASFRSFFRWLYWMFP
jgi:hypothetical protein